MRPTRAATDSIVVADIGYATDIQAYTDRPFAGRRGDFGCLDFIEIGNDDTRACGPESLGRCPPYSAGATGNENGLSFE